MTGDVRRRSERSRPVGDGGASQRVLLVHDDENTCAPLAAGLREHGFEVTVRTGGRAALEALATMDFDVVVADLQMAGMSGLALCERIVASRPDTSVIVLAAQGERETALAAIRGGAHDCLPGPTSVEAVVLGVDRAVRHRALRDEVKRLRAAVEQARRFGDVLGASRPMRRLYDLLGEAAGSDAPVLITGERGTGKELVARALHRCGSRGGAPFVSLDCAAVPEALLERELFGHGRSALPDARAKRAGLLVRGGTLFLEEIGELPLGLQSKLLRVLRDRTVRPIGSDGANAGDVRIIAATNRDLDAAVRARRFRADLHFHLAAIPIEIPPLRTRAGDILVLAQRFIDRCATQEGRRIGGLSSAAADRLLAYPWPGNVRELRNCIERAVALAPYDEITVDDLPAELRPDRARRGMIPKDDHQELVSLEEAKQRHIVRVLEATRGNRTLAARILGLNRKTLQRRLKSDSQVSPYPDERPRCMVGHPTETLASR